MYKFSKLSALPILAIAFSLMISGCMKDESMVIPEQRVFFIPSTAGTYTITGPTVTFKIPVGLTQPLNDNKSISVTVTSTSATGAAVGTQYTFTDVLRFDANRVTDTIVVQAVLSEYAAGRKDQIQFSFANAEEVSASLNPTYTLNIKGPCFEGDIVPEELLGSYDNTMDGSYGPYKTSVKSITATGPTTAIAVLGNIYDAGWNDISVSLDWTDPANTKVSFVSQNTGMDASAVNESVTGDVFVTPPRNGSSMGTYSYCNNTILLRYSLCIPSLGGCFSGVSETEMAR